MECSCSRFWPVRPFPRILHSIPSPSFQLFPFSSHPASCAYCVGLGELFWGFSVCFLTFLFLFFLLLLFGSSIMLAPLSWNLSCVCMVQFWLNKDWHSLCKTLLIEGMVLAEEMEERKAFCPTKILLLEFWENIISPPPVAIFNLWLEKSLVRTKV